MKTYFIDKIQSQRVQFTVTSISELESTAIRFVEKNDGRIARIYVRCAQIITGYGSKCEKNVEYEVRVNNQKRTVTAKRI